jgi:hypothetical protein
MRDVCEKNFLDGCSISFLTPSLSENGMAREANKVGSSYGDIIHFSERPSHCRQQPGSAGYVGLTWSTTTIFLVPA